MKNLMLMAMAVLSLGLAACDDKSTTETTEKSDVNGTVMEKETTTETKVNDDGTGSTETKSTTTVDPEGLMNKETTTHESTQEAH